MDRPRRSDCTAGQMEREAGWWTTSGNIRLPPLARVMGVDRQQHNMMDNRVLNNQPLPINDEETHLSRGQWATLSLLLSGHCKLLYSYRKRLKLTDSSSCPDCGIDQQDIPHLFNCTAHPTDLSPVNLWVRPVKTLQEQSFLDPDNLDYGLRRCEWLKKTYNNYNLWAGKG